MSGPMGGNPGANRAVGKGQRRLMTKGIRMGSYVRIYYRIPGKPGATEEEILYEGKIVDKRVGGQDRESYVELENCMELDSEDRLIELTKKKRLSDAYIEQCKVIEKRETPPEPAPKPVVAENVPLDQGAMMSGMMPGMMSGMMPGMMPDQMSGEMPGMMQSDMSGMSSAMPSGMPGMMQGGMPMQGQMSMHGQMPGQMAGQMPGQMPGQMQMQGGMQAGMQGGMMPMMSGGMQGGMMPSMMPSMMSMNGMQQGMMMMPQQGMMMGNGMQQGMMMMPQQGMMMGNGMQQGMMPMGMQGMQQGMMPNGQMGMMPMGMQGMGMMPMATGMGQAALPNVANGGMSATAASNSSAGTAGTDVKDSSSAAAKPPRKESRRSVEESVDLAEVEIGTAILVKYQHPSLGKIKYEGVLVEKEIDGTNHDSFIQLQDVKQLSATGKIRGREESKKLMFAFINQVRLAKPTQETADLPQPVATQEGAAVGERSRSRSRH